MYCINCGQKLVEEAKFCYQCGAKVVLPEEQKTPKAEAASDFVYEPDKDCEASGGQQDKHFHGKEYYRNDLDFNIYAYNGRIYYVNESYLCSCDFEGNDIKIIAKCEADCKYICVNTTGIYVYSNNSDWDASSIKIVHIGFDGQTIGKYSKKERGRISNVYIYDDRVYYVVSRYPKGFAAFGYSVAAQIKCIEVDNGIDTVLYDKAAEITRLCADAGHLYFRAVYKSGKSKGSDSDDGWMIFDLLTRKSECLSSSVCNPENVMQNQTLHGKDKDKRDIVFLDLKQGIFWTERIVQGSAITDMWGNVLGYASTKYWEPRAIWGDRNTIRKDIPVWETHLDYRVSDVHFQEYFDGIYHYIANDYYKFNGADEKGNDYRWGDWLHGNCHEFVILEDALFLDLDAAGEKQYELTLQKSDAIRKSWFGDELDSNLIARYEKL